MIKKYNKLVRDKIPKIIEENGQMCETEILSDERYLEMLELKLSEECTEYQIDKNTEALADILEVVYAIANARGMTDGELDRLRLAKANKNGRYKDKIFINEQVKNMLTFVYEEVSIKGINMVLNKHNLKKIYNQYCCITK